MKGKKGFTMIELLVVISIVGLLATLSVTAVKNSRTKTKDTKRLAEMSSVRKAMDLLYINNSNYGVSCGTYELCLGPGGTPPCINLPDNSIAACDLSPFLETVNIKDPSGSTNMCDGTNVGTCNYAFFNRAPWGQHYVIFFHLEGATILGNGGATNCLMNSDVVLCGANVAWSDCVGLGEPFSRLCSFWDTDGNGQVQNSDKNNYY